MKLTGVSMMVNKILMGMCMALPCSIALSAADILWDFGVIINSANYHDISRDISMVTTDKTNEPKLKIKAVISDPFVPPLKSDLQFQEFGSSINVNNNLTALGSEKTILQISSEAKRLYIMKNYKHVVELIQYINLSSLSPHNRKDLEYMLAHALYQSGDYQGALEQVLYSLEYNKTDELYLLLAMIYEALGQSNIAMKYYKNLVVQFPESDYASSAKIKAHILDRH